MTPDALPRPEITFPFIPNRTVDAAVKDLIGKLENSCSGFKREAGSSSEKGRAKVKKEDIDARPGPEGWKIGGSLRKDWLKRER